MKLTRSTPTALLVVLALCLLPAVATATIPNTTITSGPTGTVASTDATFAFRAEAGSDGSDPASFQCRLDSSSAGSWQACTSPISYTGLAEGSHLFEVRSKNGSGDGAGNFDPTPATATFTVAVPPQTTIDSGPGGPTASDAAAFSFSSSESGTFQCRLDSSAAAAWSACTSPMSYSSLGQGSHVFEVRALDSEGNPDPTPASATFAVDTVAPETTIDSSPTGTIDVAAARLTFSSSEAGTFECRLDSASDDDWSLCISPAELTGLAEGDHTFEVRAVDAVGNTDPTASMASFSVDTIAPETAIDVAPAPRVDVTEASFVFSAPGAAGFECRVDSTSEDAWVPCASPLVLTGLSDGAHTFEVRAVDAAGNTDSSPAVVAFAVDIPVNGTKLAVTPLAGKVRIKTPDIKRFRPLTEGETIPVGSQVDTTEGKVRLVSANVAGEQQQASFSQGTFSVGQRAGSGLVVLRLRGKLGSCADDDEAASSARSGRRLWGSGKGQFRTTGSYGSATVRGTVWFTEDRCDGTFFEVSRGIVGVRDFPRHKTISVPAGGSYLAEKPGS